MENLKRKFSFDYEEGSAYQELNQTGTPERNLLTAILERAILDYVGNDHKETECAEDWLFSAQNTDDFKPFSFQWVCERLDLDHKFVTNEIKKMPKRGKHKVAPWYFLKDKAQKQI